MVYVWENSGISITFPWQWYLATFLRYYYGLKEASDFQGKQNSNSLIQYEGFYEENKVRDCF
jgi:hypothetical protein